MIPATKITIGWSESPHIQEGKVFAGEGLWREAARYLNRFPGPDLGYYKTDFAVTFADGEKYVGRYDIGHDEPTLEDHILGFIGDVVDDGYWDQSEETLAWYRKFRNEYQLGDSTTTNQEESNE
jgi:hypothetical protein